MKAKEHERRTVPRGTVFTIGGLPLRVCRQFIAETHAENWALINSARRHNGLDPIA